MLVYLKICIIIFGLQYIVFYIGLIKRIIWGVKMNILYDLKFKDLFFILYR